MLQIANCPLAGAVCAMRAVCELPYGRPSPVITIIQLVMGWSFVGGSAKSSPQQMLLCLGRYASVMSSCNPGNQCCHLCEVV